MPNVFSVTYRPPLGDLPSLPEFVAVVVDKNVKKYYIAGEKAKEDEVCHYQCWVETVQRQDNFRTRLLKGLLKTDDNQVALKVNTVRPQDFHYCLGYCMKEDTGIVSTNISSEDCKEAFKVYDTLKSVSRKSLSGTLTVNQIVEQLYLLHVDANLKAYSSSIIKEFIRENRKAIGFQTWQKINKLALKDWIEDLL